jgi:hypothetical protein
VTPQSSGSQLPRASVIASDAAAPSAIRASHASAAGVRAARSANAAHSVATNGEGSAWRPTSSTSAAIPTILPPTPPADSGTASPAQPSSPICFQIPASQAGRSPRSYAASGSERDQRAQAFDRHVLVEEAAREVAQQLLVFAEAEIAGRSWLIATTSTSAGRARARRGCCAGPRSCRPRSCGRTSRDTRSASAPRRAPRVELVERRVRAAMSMPSRALCCEYSEPDSFIWSGRRIGWSHSAGTRARRMFCIMPSCTIARCTSASRVCGSSLARTPLR